MKISASSPSEARDKAIANMKRDSAHENERMGNRKSAIHPERRARTVVSVTPEQLPDYFVRKDGSRVRK